MKSRKMLLGMLASALAAVVVCVSLGREFLGVVLLPISLFGAAALSARLRLWKPWFAANIEFDEPPLGHFLAMQVLFDAVIVAMLLFSPHWATVLFIRLALCFGFQVGSVGKLTKDFDIHENDPHTKTDPPHPGGMPRPARRSKP